LGISIALNTITMFVLEEIGYSEPGTSIINHISPVYYLTAVLLPVMCNFIDLGFMYGKRTRIADFISEEQVACGRKIGAFDDVEMAVR
jgi:hypothetical protein